MAMKEFHLSAILSVTTEYVMAELEDFYDIHSFVMGSSVYAADIYELLYFGSAVQGELLRQFPQFSEDKLNFELGIMHQELTGVEDNEDRGGVVEAIIKVIAQNHAGGKEYFLVESLPSRDEPVLNPLETMQKLSDKYHQ